MVQWSIDDCNRGEFVSEGMRNETLDALRYRFLRSKSSRGEAPATKRCLSVEVLDWGKRLGASGMNGAFWSSKDIDGVEMDQEIDKQMAREGWI